MGSPLGLFVSIYGASFKESSSSSIFFQNLSQLQQRFNRVLLKRRNASSRVSSFSAFIAERLAVCFCDGSVEFFSAPLGYHI